MKKVAICKFEDLIGEEDAISVKTMLQLEKLKKEKYLLIVRSKKSIDELLYYNRDFPFIDYILNDKGYYFYDVKKSKKIIDNRIGKQLIGKMCKIYKKKPIKFIGENGIIKENRLNVEDIYEIIVFNNEDIQNKLGLNIKKEKDKIIIKKEALSFENIVKELCSKLKVDEKDLVHITKKKLDELD